MVLRAKDQSFNTTIRTDFDADLEKMNIIPQDMGRVLLNLLNNAFYAVNQKQKASASARYEPVISVSTRKTGENVLIAVEDNGNGITQRGGSVFTITLPV